MARSHFKRHLKEQAKKNIALSLAGILAILIFLALFGAQFLIQTSLILQKFTGQDATTAAQETGFVPPPVLDNLPNATKEPNITVSGYASNNYTISLTVNGKVSDETVPDKDNNFVFDNVPLTPGENMLKAKAKDSNGKESTYSTEVKITYKDKAPSLEVTSPPDGQGFSKETQRIKVTGKTDKGIKITVNGFWAIVQNDGIFTYNLTIHDGENTINVEATDDAGNKTEKEIKVRRE